ncbi:MAG: D-aminoacyl-tRNA deacylase [Candidatus Kapaibacteriales bacterium]
MIRLLIQRVDSSSLSVNFKDLGKIKKGYLVFLGIMDNEPTDSEIEWCVSKILNLRIMVDEDGKINMGLVAGNGIMIIPNFTLGGELKKGTRPSFQRAFNSSKSRQLFDKICKQVQTQSEESGLDFVKGIFGADMTIKSEAVGPVNLIIDK